MRYSILFVICTGICVAFAAEKSPYAGEELRPVKSLSASEIGALSRGEGMGFAKLAELNHYPGPKHVSEISEELGLSQSQRTETESLFEEMRRNAVALGEELLRAESLLDQQFASGSIDSDSLEKALLDIGQLRARLRFVHLEAHLRQKSLLTPDQVSKYDALRGYGHSH